jgi:hypothetical protein
MVTPTPSQTATRTPSPKAKEVVIKAAILILLGLLFGFIHSWAATRYYSPERQAGFHLGVVQGALMPAALPGLLMGNDLPIYAPNNIGRGYKIGFLLGINACGTLFFGVGFWPMRKR